MKKLEEQLSDLKKDKDRWFGLLEKASLPPINTTRIKDIYLKFKEMSSETSCRKFAKESLLRLTSYYTAISRMKNEVAEVV